MALNGKVLSTLVFEAMAKADVESARKSRVLLEDGTAISVDTETPQKQLERKGTADAIAITIIEYFIENTEVIIPDHSSAAAITGLGGPGPHTHSMNQPPFPHKIGKIK